MRLLLPARFGRGPGRLLALAVLAWLTPSERGALAHTVGEGYIFLTIRSDRIEGRVEVHMDDLDRRFTLDTDRDGKVSADEFAPRAVEAARYVANGVSLGGDAEPVELEFGEADIWQSNLGRFVKVPFQSTGEFEAGATLEVRYDLFFDVDPDHRGLLIVEFNSVTGVENNEEAVALVFKASAREKTLDLTGRGESAVLFDLFIEGIWHIWIGLDHILFLVALLLPAVLVRRNGPWVPVESFREALLEVVKVVTLFTLAHSVTLSLAVLEVIQLPSRLVESVIAASIAVAALDNIYPIFQGKIWMVVFGFGLFHGFGFASVLGGLGIGSASVIAPLVGFNLGVEVGQIAIISAIFPVLFLLRGSRFYTRAIVPFGSLALIALALWWLAERAL